MCQNCDAAHALGTRSALSVLSAKVVRGSDLPTAVETMKRETREMAAAENEPLSDMELSALDSMIDTTTTILAMSVQQLRETAERISPTIPDTTEGLIP